MPHKHTRRPGEGSDKEFNLPPTSHARPLSVTKKQRGQAINNNEQANSKKRKRGKDGAAKDDTPREFKRLMQMQAHMEARARGGRVQSSKDVKQRPNQRSPPHPSRESASNPPPPATAAPSTSEPTAVGPTASAPRRPRGLDDPASLHRGTTTRDIAVLRQPRTRLQKKIDKKVAAWRVDEGKLRAAEADAAATRRELEGERVAGVLSTLR